MVKSSIKNGDNMLINIERINKLDNYRLMKNATEIFMQFIYFLEQERNYKNLNLKIGSFEYDGWYADIYCILDDKGVYFKHIRDFDKKEWSDKTLLQAYAFAWEFENTEFKFNFDIINNYYELLNETDKEIYDYIFDEVHERLW